MKVHSSQGALHNPSSLVKRMDNWKIIGPGGGGGQFIPTISPHDPNTVLIACDMTAAYITHDGGQSWREFNLRSRVSVFYFDPVDSMTIYAGSAGLFRSNDCGYTWHLLFPHPSFVTDELMVGDHSSNILKSDDNWPGHASITSITVDCEETSHIYIAVHAQHLEATQIFHSRDGGERWAEIARVSARKTHHICIDKDSLSANRRVFVFTDSEIYSIGTASSNAVQVTLPKGIDSITHATSGVNPLTDRHVFYITTPSKWVGDDLISGVWKSTDLGETWKEVKSVIGPDMAGPESGQLLEVSLVQTSRMDSRYIYLGVTNYPEVPQDCASGSIVSSHGYRKSVDEGETWTWALKADFHTDPANLQGGWVENHYTPSWNWIGPKGMGPLGLGVCDTNPQIVYGTDMGSTYRSLNGGKTWDQVYSNENPDGSVSSRGLHVTTCYGVHFDPFDQDHIVISYTDIGLFHSYNNGQTWHHALNGISPDWGNTCYWVVFDPDIKGKAWAVWASIHDLPRPKMYRSGKFFMGQGGVSKTEDGLATWHKSNQGMPENCVSTHIVLDASSPPGKRTLYVAGFDKGVYKSTDDGITWTLKNNGINHNLNAWRLVLLPDGTLYLVIARGLKRGTELEGAVYKSVNGAETWEKLKLPVGVNAPNDLIYDPSHPQRMYLACWPKTSDGREHYGGVYASDDGGTSWSNVFDESKHVYGVEIDPQNTSTIFINTFDNAAYRSDDSGISWKRLKGYNFKWGHRPIVDPHHKDMIYLTTFGSSVWHGPAHGDEDAFEDIHPYL